MLQPEILICVRGHSHFLTGSYEQISMQTGLSAFDVHDILHAHGIKYKTRNTDGREHDRLLVSKIKGKEKVTYYYEHFPKTFT